jgi:hypothetical protein
MSLEYYELLALWRRLVPADPRVPAPARQKGGVSGKERTTHEVVVHGLGPVVGPFVGGTDLRHRTRAALAVAAAAAAAAREGTSAR